jgi:hypothetical protein
MDSDFTEISPNPQADLKLRLGQSLMTQHRFAERQQAVSKDVALLTLERLQSVLPYGLRSVAVQPTINGSARPATLDAQALVLHEALAPMLASDAWPYHILALMDTLEKAECLHDLDTSLVIIDALIQAHIRDGRYQTARDWANWISRLLDRSANPFRRSQAWWSAHLLGGGVEDVRAALISVATNTNEHDMDLLFELTICDAHASVGHLQTALEQYAHLWTHCQARELLGALALRYVQALCETQQLAKALEVANQAVSLSLGLAAQPEAHLAQAIALAHHAPIQARPILERLLIESFNPMDAQMLVRTAAQLARVCLHLNDPIAAQQAIDHARPALNELGPCGHRLLIGSSSVWQAVYALITPSNQTNDDAEQNSLELRFLGQCSASLAGQPLHLRRRFAEIIAVLAMNPDGLTGEQLTLAVYGDAGTLECCKTELSRLRRLVPIKTRPYQLGTEVKADFLDFEVLLEQGEIEMALAIHTGPLLPDSDAPEVVAHREHLEEAIRQVALQSQDPNLLWHCAERSSEDLDLWQATVKVMERTDPRRAVANARMDRLHKTWCL